MKLTDYVHGSIPQNNDRPASQGAGKIIPASRLRAAELARVSVPPTRLNGFPGAPAPGINGHQRLQGLQAPAEQRSVFNQGRLEHGDMFDTDVEGIDDSTTTMSLCREEDIPPPPVAAPEERLASPRRGKDNGIVARRHGGDASSASPLQALNAAFEPRRYSSIADRMKELDSDDDGQVASPVRNYDRVEAYPDHHGAGGFDEDEPTIKVSDLVGYGKEQQQPLPLPMSWQQIEAALKEPSDISDRVHVSENTSTNQAELQGNGTVEIGHGGHFDAIQATTTPRPPRSILPGGRFTPRSRFVTPRPPKPPTPLSISRIPRPISFPGMPDQALSPLNAEYRADQLPLSPSQTDSHNDQYHTNQVGMFDTTDLSALDSSEDSITEPNAPATTTSPQLSTLSPVSSKRPFTAFTSDYHPNILQSKSFSDLHTEPFDYNPAPAPPVFPSQDPDLPLPEKLQRLKSLTDDQRRTFFSSLTLAEWEDSGDWLIDQFSALLQKTKEARRERRNVAAVFEGEIKRRYELVEGEAKDIRQRMDSMRAGGMGVLNNQGQ
ncbi:hypothetical protein LOZ61_002780 [Ophidiomyces ophidiicola]|nr:hypothetical protein LOZ61_002780 [Ophidiomyces ophidiicola]KAI1919665.1 hypothetical protein LOZ64_002173 [Ophidiomyces ophidiicola]KAI1928114.1 hypothetical protein LOZ60_002607 [Ophidiomyces ophidiicola]KAI2004249.1 hypothetical protein LOZ50_004388 [Ophidiomyces ophidiicola]KAI2007287.1 hypothetical protein LOZ49_004686 [Ophidiomyces ophidiicola]